MRDEQTDRFLGVAKCAVLCYFWLCESILTNQAELQGQHFFIQLIFD